MNISNTEYDRWKADFHKERHLRPGQSFFNHFKLWKMSDQRAATTIYQAKTHSELWDLVAPLIDHIQ